MNIIMIVLGLLFSSIGACCITGSWNEWSGYEFQSVPLGVVLAVIGVTFFVGAIVRMERIRRKERAENNGGQND